MQPVRAHKVTGAEMKERMSLFQRAKAPPLKLFRGNNSDVAEAKKVVYEIETIKPSTEAGRRRWQYLHNTPCIKVIAEKDYMSHKDGLTTVIRFMRFVEEETSEDLVDDLLPE